MKIQFNWGTGISITIIVFICIMVSIIIFSMNQQVNLVSPDYYPKGVDYNKQITKTRNANALTEKVIGNKVHDSLVISFPKEFDYTKVSGKVQFYFITDFKKDITKQINLNKENKQSFLLSSFTKGRYIIKLDWKDSAKEYYQEIDINL